MRAILYITALCVFCGALMISCNSTGQDQEFVVFSGMVTESDSTTGIAGVIVTDGLTSSIVDTTDERGFFQLRGIDKKKHTVSLTKDGLEPVEYEFEYLGELARPLISKKFVMNPVEE
ncbi:MAG: hypothetical protein R3F48_04915 [Candidatus Zixiibacteriota bacterium]